MKFRCAQIHACLLGVVLLAPPVAVHAQDPAITNQPASRALWAGGNVKFSVGVTGTGPFIYQWQLNGTNVPNGIITTVAGTGTGGGFVYINGVAATKAFLVFPKGVVSDDAGNFFILDHGEYRIHEVDTNGIITTITGIGTSGYSGDEGPATNAAIAANDIGILLDKLGNIIFADFGNNRIRKVDTNGTITTIAGNGVIGYSGDGSPATNAVLSGPYDVATDNAGDLFILDQNNHRIRKVDTNGIIWTVAGNGTNGYSGDGGMATNAMLGSCSGISIDGADNLFISDNSNSRIRKVDTNGIITTVAGTGEGGFSGDGGLATNAMLVPAGIKVDKSGNLFFSDQVISRIRKVDTNNIISTVAGTGVSLGTYGYSGDGGAATNAKLYLPYSVGVDNAGNVFIPDTNNHCVRKVTNTQAPIFALNNVSITNAGSYQVIITGANGSVTSSVVNLVVASSPLIYQTALNPDRSVSLSFLSQPGTTNVVLCTTNLASPVVWQTIATNLAGSDGTWQFTDTNAAGNQSLFYRSLTQ